MTEPRASKFRAAAIGGLVLGVASAAPVINIANCACCSLVVLGGFLASHLYLKSAPYEPSPPWGDAAIVGLLAGLIGAAVTAVLSLPIALLGSSMGMWSTLQQVFSETSLPPELRNLFATLGSGTLALAMVLFAFALNLFLYSLFATMGALLGVAVLHKKPTALTPL